MKTFFKTLIDRLAPPRSKPVDPVLRSEQLWWKQQFPHMLKQRPVCLRLQPQPGQLLRHLVDPRQGGAQLDRERVERRGRWSGLWSPSRRAPPRQPFLMSPGGLDLPRGVQQQQQPRPLPLLPLPVQYEWRSRARGGRRGRLARFEHCFVAQESLRTLGRLDDCVPLGCRPSRHLFLRHPCEGAFVELFLSTLTWRSSRENNHCKVLPRTLPMEVLWER